MNRKRRAGCNEAMKLMARCTDERGPFGIGEAPKLREFPISGNIPPFLLIALITVLTINSHPGR